MEQKSNKTIVLECYRKIIRDLDLTLADAYIKEDYIQHSPTVKTGREGILTMLTFLKSMPKSAEILPSPIIRVIADNDFVAVHLDVKFMGKRMAVIDLYRLENGQLAEHWDSGQIQPEYENTSITMTNGITVIEGADAGKNKKIIGEFYGVLSVARLDDARNFLTPAFIEHNAAFGLIGNCAVGIKVYKIIAEGNFVLTQCECSRGGKSTAQYNIFKMEDDKIAEHWSVEQEVPDTMAHTNGMF